MQILQVSPSDQGGGAEAVARHLFEAYRRRGHRSWLVVGEKQGRDDDIVVLDSREDRGRWAAVCREAGEWLSPLVGRIRGAGRLQRGVALGVGQPMRALEIMRGREDFAFPATHRLFDLIPDVPELLHCHNLHGAWLRDGGFFDLRALPALSRRLPVVLTLHDAWLLSGHCAHSFDCLRWQTGCGACPDLSIYPAVSADATAYNWSRKQAIFSNSRLHVATPSRWLMEKVNASMLAPAAVECRVIANGIDVELFCPGEKRRARHLLGLPQEDAMLLFAATDIRRNAWKDFGMILKAVENLQAGIEGRGLLCVALGAAASQERLGRAHIRYVPFERDPARVADYYRAADVYVHAAKADTFPTAVLEAMACGTPVVATAVGGIPEQVVEGETGFLVPGGDAAAMAARLALLLARPHTSMAFGERGARIARSRFGIQSQVDAYLAWYSHILAERRAGESSCRAGKG